MSKQKTVSSRDQSGRFRLDFEFVKVEGDTIILVLNPERYEIRPNGRAYDIYDRLDHLVISQRTFEETLRKTKPLPIYNQQADKANWAEYLYQRLPAITAMVEGELPEFPLMAGTESLRGRLGKAALFSIVQIEIANRLEILAKVSDEKYAAISRAFVYEAVRIAKAHKAEPLFLADGKALFYFAAPSYIGKADLAASCLQVLDALVAVANVALENLGLPNIRYRAAMESGEASAHSVGHMDVDSHIELIGHTRSSAEAICAKSPEDGIYIGPRAAAALHTSWRKLLVEVECPSDLHLRGEFGDRPSLYELRLDSASS